jgi:hypothetical protein
MRARLIVAMALLAVGAVWIGQGLGVFPGSSFMVDDLRWAGLGAVAVVVGLVIAISALRGRPKA